MKPTGARCILDGAEKLTKNREATHTCECGKIRCDYCICGEYYGHDECSCTCVVTLYRADTPPIFPKQEPSAPSQTQNALHTPSVLESRRIELAELDANRERLAIEIELHEKLEVQRKERKGLEEQKADVEIRLWELKRKQAELDAEKDELDRKKKKLGGSLKKLENKQGRLMEEYAENSMKHQNIN